MPEPHTDQSGALSPKIAREIEALRQKPATAMRRREISRLKNVFGHVQSLEALGEEILAAVRSS